MPAKWIILIVLISGSSPLKARQAPVLLQSTPGITLTCLQLQAPGNRHCTLINILTHTPPQTLITFQFFHQPGDTLTTLTPAQASQRQPTPLNTFISQWTADLQSAQVLTSPARFHHEYQLMRFNLPLLYFDGTTWHDYTRIPSVAKFFRIIHQPGQAIFQNGLFTLNTAATPVAPTQQPECGSTTPIPAYPGLWTDTAINRRARGNIFLAAQNGNQYQFFRHHFANCHHCLHLATESFTFTPGIGITHFTSRTLQRQTPAKINQQNPNTAPDEFTDSPDFYNFLPLTANNIPWAQFLRRPS